MFCIKTHFWTAQREYAILRRHDESSLCLKKLAKIDGPFFTSKISVWPTPRLSDLSSAPLLRVEFFLQANVGSHRVRSSPWCSEARRRGGCRYLSGHRYGCPLWTVDARARVRMHGVGESPDETLIECRGCQGRRRSRCCRTGPRSPWKQWAPYSVILFNYVIEFDIECFNESIDYLFC